MNRHVQRHEEHSLFPDPSLQSEASFYLRPSLLPPTYEILLYGPMCDDSNKRFFLWGDLFVGILTEALEIFHSGKGRVNTLWLWSGDQWEGSHRGALNKSWSSGTVFRQHQSMVKNFSFVKTFFLWSNVSFPLPHLCSFTNTDFIFSSVHSLAFSYLISCAQRKRYYGIKPD